MIMNEEAPVQFMLKRREDMKDIASQDNQRGIIIVGNRLYMKNRI